jgi:hypothetical protein
MLSRLVRSALPTALAVVMVAAGTASAATLRGVVVHRDHHSKGFVVALSGGRMVAVNASHSPRVGRLVSVKARRSRGGTFTATHVKVLRRARHARIRGVVTFVDRRHGEFTVSSQGVSVLVHRSTHANDVVPSVGDEVEVEVGIDDQGDLGDDGDQVTGTETDNIDLEGMVLAVGSTARTLTISADEDEQSGASLTVHVPTTIDISMFTVGQDVELTVSKQTDGTFLLQAVEDVEQPECGDVEGGGTGTTTCTGGTSGGGGTGTGVATSG